MNKIYIDDLNIGDIFNSESFEFTKERIIHFAKEFDPQTFHCDEEQAKEYFFKELVASGLHTNAVTMKLLVGSLPLANGIVGVSMDVNWYNPIKLGDTVFLRTEITDINMSLKDPRKGYIFSNHDLYNQQGILCQRLKAKLLSLKRN
jgi:acyl dehydratase